MGECYDEAEHRARELAERAGIPWHKANVAAWLALADREIADRREHEPSGWAIFALAVGLALGGIGLLLWAVWYSGGGA
jgi:hypothetical protein